MTMAETLAAAPDAAAPDAAKLGFAARSVAEIAATLPGATAVFRRHRPDFCCGGAALLAAAAAARGADLVGIEAELAALVHPEAAAPAETDPAACVAFRPKAA